MEIPENALGKLSFSSIYIDEKCSSLKRIHSNAFSYQTNNTYNLLIGAKSVISGPSPYNFYDLANSFKNLDRLSYKGQIGTLEEKLDFQKLTIATLRVDDIKGSPFAHMSSFRIVYS
jgi:hypothetical protein